MKLRVRRVSFIEVTELKLWSYAKVYFFLLRKIIKKDIHDGNGLVIVRDERGEYKGFISPNALTHAKGNLNKALRKNRIIQSDKTKEEVEEFFKKAQGFPKYCPLFEEEKFLGLAYFDFAVDILAEELQVIHRHYEWGGEFWKDKILLKGEDSDIAEGFEAVGSLFSVSVVADARYLKDYGGKHVIDQKSFKEINGYVRRMDLQSTLKGLEETGVSVIVCRIPFLDEIGELTEDEKIRSRMRISGAYVREPNQNMREQLQKVYGEDYPLWEKGEVACTRQYYSEEQGIYKLVDRKGEGTNVVDGKRVTTGTPDEWQNSIYIIGPCTVLGNYVKDEDTIPSCIQRQLNREYPGEYRVVNLGTDGFYEGDSENISKLTLRKADILIFINYFQKEKMEIPSEMRYIELTKSFLKRDRECFFDMPKHVNAEGCRRIADTIWREALQGTVGKLDNLYKGREQRNYVIKKADYSFCINGEVGQFVQSLHKKKFPIESNNIGAIVMNCNPFTLGHRYLIETAAEQVDYLYVFVVEEDKSYFCFQDRINMVIDGTRDLKNVCVLPSGKYVLSASTMPEYFTKEMQQNITVCASDDLEIFGMYIAPALGIVKRFVGEEPFDKITQQYNESMKRILPEYGIELICIARKEDERNEAISASRVRRLLVEKRYEEIEKIVPNSTFLYLKQNLFEMD